MKNLNHDIEGKGRSPEKKTVVLLNFVEKINNSSFGQDLLCLTNSLLIILEEISKVYLCLFRVVAKKADK